MQAVAMDNVCVCACVWTGYILTIHNNNNHDAEEQLCKGQFTEKVPTASEGCRVCIDASMQQNENALNSYGEVRGGGM